MKKREFNKLLKIISTKNKLDISKFSILTDDAREQMIYMIVRYRMPIVKDLIPPHFNLSLLPCLGYLYETKGKEYTFIHTCEHKIL